MAEKFNSADIEAFKNVWVFCEQRQGEMMPTTFELISEGRKLADELGVDLCGILLGDDVDGLANELGGYGADRVYVYNSPMLKNYTTDAYTKVICDAVKEFKPEILLVGASNIGRDLAPRCAARLHTGLCADCTHLDVDVANYQTAITNLEQVIQMDAGYNDGAAMLLLAEAYQGNGDQDQANVYYQRIIEDYADTDAAQSAQEALDEQNGTSSDENAEDGAGQDSSSESSGEN